MARLGTFYCRFSRKVVSLFFGMGNKRDNIAELVSKMPMAVVVALFAMGIFLGDRVEVPIWLYVAVMTLLLCGAFVVKGWLRMAGIAAVVLFLGAALHTTSFRGDIPYNQPVNMLLKVEQMSAVRDGYTSTEATIVESEADLLRGCKVVVWGDSLVRFSTNDRVQICTPVRAFRAERERYAKLMHTRGFVGSVSVSGRGTYGYIPAEGGSLHDFATRRLQEALGESAGRSVVLAMTVGERGELTSELRQGYARAGASHLLAVSGLHVGVVFLVVNILMVPLAMLRYGNVVRSLVAIVLVWLYVVMCGMSPSAVRAAVMFSFLQYSIGSLRRYDSVNILATTAFVMLMCNTRLLFDISFELSFLAVAGIGLWGVPLYRLLTTRYRVVNSLTAVMCVGVASTLATMPLVASTFSVVSLVGVAINPIVILLANIIIACGAVAVAVPAVAPLAGWAAELQNRVVEIAAGWPYSHIDYQLSEGAMWGVYAVMAVATALFFVVGGKK